MQLTNIGRLLLFREDGTGQVLGLQQLRDAYGIDPAGTNYYYGLDEMNAHAASDSGSAWTPAHREFIDGFLDALKATKDDEKTLVLGVEPSQTPDPYGFIAGNLGFVRMLAADLNAAQQQARGFGKRMNVVIRYASEMNDRSQRLAHDPNFIINFSETSTFDSFSDSFGFSATDKTKQPGETFSGRVNADAPVMGTIYWNPKEGTFYMGVNGHVGWSSPEVALLHEATHAMDYASDPSRFLTDLRTPVFGYGNLEEERVIRGFEAEALFYSGQLERSNHSSWLDFCAYQLLCQ